ncbi:Nif3-like dinuclear metal center hexameric protein [Cohnella zeiphila]|uniref:GTP cyclohydrolase 1 type 2 homolog n=1 Tax=Cohnella zeiphila TaxID=2761120 RepID=A0A7X0ST68_9BACL|nr:Nif3-like dinuclear metal center hexameric protein [Cohnella zeiphila]MBB6734684.1 Nif3-like dinuclear metal center hexameric protein [Cohnella zeiphila]
MPITVQQAITRLIEPVGLLSDTVDTLKSGRGDDEVKGIAVVFTATYSAIRQAAEAGANLIITHEPTYYNHRDEGDWLSGDPVYERKQALIEETRMSIFRLHDYIHWYKPDGIVAGMLKKLEWEAYSDPDDLKLLTLPADQTGTVRSIAAELKAKLGIDSVQVAGDPDLTVRRFGLLVGALGGQVQMRYMRDNDLDLLIAGETNEWETNEYVRDASDMGLNKALIIAGHQKSEEAGMETAAELLRLAFPELPVFLIEHPTALQRI